jgi:NAD(P)-dependent dehydrogenase (short-subunit alcohol dehydrogenase family)
VSGNKVALVTGASRNIGRAIALALASAGHAVACFGRDRDALEETARAIQARGGTASVFVGDAKSSDSLKEFSEHAIAALGGIDVVVNNAGVMTEAKPAELDPERFAADLQVNLVGPFALARAAYLTMKARGGGIVINIGSIAGAMAFPRAASYCASKAGLDGLTRQLAYDWARDNIRVVCIAPGYVESEISKAALADDAARDWILKRIPQRRVARPEEIAGLAAFLASDAASFITGETYYIDGGQRTAI